MIVFVSWLGSKVVGLLRLAVRGHWHLFFSQWMHVHLFISINFIPWNSFCTHYTWWDFSVVSSISWYISIKVFELNLIPCSTLFLLIKNANLWTKITFVFFLFNSNAFSLLPASAMSSNLCKFCLCPAIVLPVHHVRMLCLPTLIPGYISGFHIITSL